MNTDRLEALLWARIDGTIEPEELAELEAHLAEHPEPREIERKITTIAHGLDTREKIIFTGRTFSNEELEHQFSLNGWI